jgi:hypothetical protein
MRIQGSRADSHLGDLVAPAGDFNGDGAADIILSASDPERGKVLYLI